MLDGSYEIDGVDAHAVPGERAGLTPWVFGSSKGQSAQVAGARGLPLRGRHPAVVRLGGDVVVAQQPGQLHGVAAGGDVDDARPAPLLVADELLDDADGQASRSFALDAAIEAEDQVVADEVARVGGQRPPLGPIPSGARRSRSCTWAVAVAVRAWTGSRVPSGPSGSSRAMSRKSGRKSWPQVAMQWASSTTSCTSGSCGR